MWYKHYKSQTWVTVEGDSISRKAELTRVEHVSPSLASNRPEGHLHTALGPGAKTHMCEQYICPQGFLMPIWSVGWMICKPHVTIYADNITKFMFSQINPQGEHHYLDAKRLLWPFQNNKAVFASDFMSSLDHSLLRIRPVEHVVQHCQGERVCDLLHLQNLKVKIVFLFLHPP